MRKRTVIATSVAAIGLLTVVGLVWYAVLAVPVGTALAAKQLCSLTFISRLEPERAVALYVNPLIGPLAPALSWSLDPTTRTVRTSAFGLAPAEAAVHPGHGCIQLVNRTRSEVAVTLPKPPQSEASATERVKIVPAVQTAVEQTLQAPGTLAILVAHEGVVIAESYADGVHPNTPLPGWSMAKSVTATLAGLMSHRELLDVHAKNLAPDWAADERAAITLDQILRMTSGIDLPETRTGADANSFMLFRSGNAFAFALDQPLAATPGERFDYSSGSTVLASGLLTRALGGPAETYAFIKEALLDPLGMHHTQLEADESGTFIGSSFVLSTPRDWAKLGQLYLQMGTWEGEQLFDPAWVRYITTHTQISGDRPYGAGFWLARPAPEGHPRERWPADAFAASGLQSNRMIIVPSEQLVVVRLGATRRYSDTQVDELLAAVLAEISPGADR